MSQAGMFAVRMLVCSSCPKENNVIFSNFMYLFSCVCVFFFLETCNLHSLQLEQKTEFKFYPLYLSFIFKI